MDLTGWKVLIEPTEHLLEKIHRDGSLEALAQIGIEDADHLTDLLNERSLTFAETRAAEMVGMRNIGSKAMPEWIENPNAKWVITDSTRKMVRKDVAQAIEEGWSAQHLARTLQEDNPAFSDHRAKTIARTEIRNADTAGNMEAYKASKIVQGKEWIVGSEHDDHDECDLNQEAGEIELDATFPSGDSKPAAHPNCVCDFLPVLIEKKTPAPAVVKDLEQDH